MLTTAAALRGAVVENAQGRDARARMLRYLVTRIWPTYPRDPVVGPYSLHALMVAFGATLRVHDALDGAARHVAMDVWQFVSVPLTNVTFVVFRDDVLMQALLARAVPETTTTLVVDSDETSLFAYVQTATAVTVCSGLFCARMRLYLARQRTFAAVRQLRHKLAHIMPLPSKLAQIIPLPSFWTHAEWWHVKERRIKGVYFARPDITRTDDPVYDFRQTLARLNFDVPTVMAAFTANGYVGNAAVDEPTRDVLNALGRAIYTPRDLWLSAMNVPAFSPLIDNGYFYNPASNEFQHAFWPTQWNNAENAITPDELDGGNANTDDERMWDVFRALVQQQ